MPSTILLRALVQRPASVICTLFILTLLTAFGGGSLPVVLVLWIVASALATAGAQLAERIYLRLRGCRPLDSIERRRYAAALEGLEREVLVMDRSTAWCLRSFRMIAIGAGVFDVFDQRQLRALLTSASLFDPAMIAGRTMVWIGCLPILMAWHVNRWIMRLGGLLAFIVGKSLIVPLIVWPDGFVRCVGFVFGAMLSGMLSSLLISSGVVAPGLALMTAWAVVPTMRKLLTWETERAENAADEAAIANGVGWDLMSTIEWALWYDPQPEPPVLLALLGQVWTARRSRLDRVSDALSEARKA